jgi:shikimate kinase
MLFVGKMGSGKTNDVLKHLMMTDSLGPNVSPFYSKIVYSGSVGEDDEIYSTLKKALTNLIIQVPPNKLMEFLNEHLRVKKKYSAICKYIMNDFKEPNKTMQRIL